MMSKDIFNSFRSQASNKLENGNIEIAKFSHDFVSNTLFLPHNYDEVALKQSR
jgi:hypothetical protein